MSNKRGNVTLKHRENDLGKSVESPLRDLKVPGSKPDGDFSHFSTFLKF